MIRIKVYKRCKNFSKRFSSKCSHGEVENSLDAQLTFFGQPAESFPLDIRKKQFVSFAKNFHPKVFVEIENQVMTTPSFLFQELVKEVARCPKLKKKIEINLFFVEMLPWTRKMQFQHLRRKNRQKTGKFPANCLKMVMKFICFLKQVSFLSRNFPIYEEYCFDRPAKLFLLN